MMTCSPIEKHVMRISPVECSRFFLRHFAPSGGRNLATLGERSMATLPPDGQMREREEGKRRHGIAAKTKTVLLGMIIPILSPLRRSDNPFSREVAWNG